MASTRSRSEDWASHSPSLWFLLAEGCWLLVLVALIAPNHLPNWGRQLYCQTFGTSASAFQAPQYRYSLLVPPSTGVTQLGSLPTAAAATQAMTLPIQPSASSAAASSALVPMSHPRWTPETVDYFMEVAMGSEYGSGNSIRKWQDGLRIRVFGDPTESDLQTLKVVTQELSQFTGLSIVWVDQSPNVEIYFAPTAEFAQIEPHYKPGNEGFFWTWDEKGVINRAKVLINSQQTDIVRSHLLREELTQSLGLMNDSYRDPNSLFYQGWTQTTAFTPDDCAVIQMLYQPDIHPDMTKTEVRQLLGKP